MLTVTILFVALVSTTLGSENEDPSDAASTENAIIDPSACASEFLEWCRNRSAAGNQNYGVSILSHSNFDGNQRVAVFCFSNSTGTNCTRNDSPWFLCFSNGTLMYKGKELGAGSQDDNICSTKDQAKKMFGPYHIPFNKTAFEIGMKVFRERMRGFEEQMRNLSERMRGMFHNRMNRNKDP